MPAWRNSERRKLTEHRSWPDPSSIESKYEFRASCEGISNFCGPNSGHAFFRIAQSYDLAGEKKEAAIAYRVFLQSWRNADPDLPQVKTAKARLKEYETENE